MEKGIFKKGDNPLVDRNEFKVNVNVTPTKDYPIDATYGKMIKAPEEMNDVRGQVTADYQNLLEEQWVKELRKKYPVVINPRGIGHSQQALTNRGWPQNRGFPQ